MPFCYKFVIVFNGILKEKKKLENIKELSGLFLNLSVLNYKTHLAGLDSGIRALLSNFLNHCESKVDRSYYDKTFMFIGQFGSPAV